jgi:hypothetical protein
VTLAIREDMTMAKKTNIGKSKKRLLHKEGIAKTSDKSHIWIFVLLGIALFLFAYNVTSSMLSTSDSTELSQPTCKYIQVPYESQEAYLKTEYYTERVPYTDKVCEQKDIPYAIDNFRFVSSTCNQYREICQKYFLGLCTEKTVFCVDRTVSCALDLRNLDTEERAYFTIRFNFFERGSSSYIKYNEDSKLVYAQSSRAFTGTVRISSDGEDGDANKEISCNHVIMQRPTKMVCRDVINYRDIQRERQVTAYRPLTKYRSERVCI